MAADVKAPLLIEMLRLLGCWVLVFLLIFPWLGLCKMCTNTGVSHTLRSQYMNAVHSSIFSADLVGISTAAVRPEHSRLALEKLVKNNKRNASSEFLDGVSLHNVRLLSGSAFAKAEQTNLEYLLMLDVDNLVHSFRNNSGLDAPGTPYGGWESPDSELRGHFVGHYLSATALMWASTGNGTIYKKMNTVVQALSKCQEKVGTGYLSAFPASFFDRFEALQPVWAPYYTIHKIMAGLLDQYTLAGNDLALTMVQGMADYFVGRVKSVIEQFSIERHWQSLNEETGGMNDVMYRLYMVTGNVDHLWLAHLFDKPCFLGLLAIKADSISGFHANTHIPVVVGAQMRYEATGDALYKSLTEYFLDIVSSSHTYATGGNSVGEFWSDPKRLGSTLDSENEESCTTYNTLKVSRNLFRWTKHIKYADFYERALLNGVLSIQRGTEPGVMIYMLPMGPGSSKAKTYHGWGTPFDSFWCCYGTATESFSKLGDSIYFEKRNSPHLYVVQFVSSTVFWQAAGLEVKQIVQDVTSINPVLNATFEFVKKATNDNGNMATIFIRIPYWASSSGCQCSLNGQVLDAPAPGSFYNITRSWKSGDKLSLSFRAMLRLEKIQDEREEYSSLYAIYFGPYLLAGVSDGDSKLGPVNVSSPLDWIVPASGRLYTFSKPGDAQEQVLVSSKDGSSLYLASKPAEGSQHANLATFRVVNLDRHYWSSSMTGRRVLVELMHKPGSYISHTGNGHKIVVSRLATSSVFRMIHSTGGKTYLEAGDLPGCYLASSSGSIELSCSNEASEDSRFIVTNGAAIQHPMSFIATGLSSTFLLFPLNAYKDENYTVYFDVSNPV